MSSVPMEGKRGCVSLLLCRKCIASIGRVCVISTYGGKERVCQSVTMS